MNGNTKKKSMQNNNNNNNKKIMINVQLKNYEGCMKIFGKNLSLVQEDNIPSKSTSIQRLQNNGCRTNSPHLVPDIPVLISRGSVEPTCVLYKVGNSNNFSRKKCHCPLL